MKIHPLNAKGKYYINEDSYCCNAVCEVASPDIFKPNGNDYGYHVAKQPETVEEKTQCIEAMMCCPDEAIFDDGEIRNQ